MKEKFTFFWGGIFSQWCPSKFTIDGVEYNCCEQYMMLKKALLFNDFDTAAKIMGTKNPRDQKQFGREVKNFNKDLWEKWCRKFVYDANYAKFSQDSDLYDGLMLTRGTTLVEASPEDKIWGIGLRESDSRALDRNTWQGTNWLGEIITTVRSDFEQEEREAFMS